MQDTLKVPVIKKKQKERSPFIKPIQFPGTIEMKRKLDEIKKSKAVDVDINEMFRQFAQRLIEQIETKAG